MSTVIGQATDPTQPGVLGTPMNVNVPLTQAVGVKGDGGAGFPSSNPTVPGIGRTAVGVLGTSADPNGVGVWGESTAGGTGVYGRSKGTAGAFDGNVVVTGGNVVVEGNLTANSRAGQAIKATSTDVNNDTINATSSAQNHAALSANNISQPTGAVPSGFALWANSNATAVFAQGNPAGYFHGDIQVTGDVILVNSSGDVAEDFDVEEGASHGEPGTVLVIGSNGKLCASMHPYDTRVAGVVSGAGNLRPAIVLQRIESSRHRSSIALVGKAFCKVDALFGSIQPGDLLTTSSTPGHAMKLIDHTRATGSILGKALGGLVTGQGLIPILVSPR